MFFRKRNIGTQEYMECMNLIHKLQSKVEGLDLGQDQIKTQIRSIRGKINHLSHSDEPMESSKYSDPFEFIRKDGI